MTLAHLMEHSSGLKEKEGFRYEKDRLRTALDAPIVTPPGEVCLYNNAGANVLSSVISAAAGQDPERYIHRKVWKPLGMNRTYWQRDGAGNSMAYSGVRTTARDFARFGQFYLSKGEWQGKRILSEKWIEQSTAPRRLLYMGPLKIGQYGLLWFVDNGHAEDRPHNYSALGLHGNNLTVIPELDLVGVRLVGADKRGTALMFLPDTWAETLAGVIEREKPKKDAKAEGR